MSLCTHKDSIYLGCGNIRTMYVAGKAAQVNSEMDNRLEILGLSEVRWPGNGKTILQSGTVVLFSGTEDEMRQKGVEMMLSKNANKALIEWKPINGRMMWVRFYTRTLKLSIIQMYAPTNVADEEEKDVFSEQLQSIIDGIPKHDVQVIMGDTNGKIGDNNEGFERYMGNHGTGERNENGMRVLSFSEFNNMAALRTIFVHKPRHKVIWISLFSSPRGVRLKCYYAFFLVCCGCDTSHMHVVSAHIQCLASIYTLSLCRGHSWRVRLAKQETLTPPGHLVSPLVCRSP